MARFSNDAGGVLENFALVVQQCLCLLLEAVQLPLALT
jgi:hypothetical protein